MNQVGLDNVLRELSSIVNNDAPNTCAMPQIFAIYIRGPLFGYFDNPMGGNSNFSKKFKITATLSHTHTSSQTKNTMSNTTPNTQTPTNPTNTQNVAVKQLTKEEVKAVAKFNQKKKDKETIRNENIKKMKNTASISVEEGLFSPPRMKFQTSLALFPKPFAIGDYVEVMEDFSPNMNRHKGIGWVTQVLEKDDGDLSLTVQYDIGKHILSNIAVDAVTKIPFDFSSSRSRTANSELKRKAAVSTSDGNSDAKKARTTDKLKGMTKAEVLVYGLSEAAKTNKRKGWYRIC